MLTLWGEPVSRVYWVLGTCISGWAAWSLLQKGPSLLGFLCLVGTAGFVAAGAIGVSFLAYDPKAKELLRGRRNWLGSRLQLESARILGVAVVARYAFEGGNRVQNWGACLLTDGQAVWLGPLQSDQNRAESEADRVASELGLGRVDPSMIDQCSGGTLLLEFPSRLQSLLSFSAAFTSGFAIVAASVYFMVSPPIPVVGQITLVLTTLGFILVAIRVPLRESVVVDPPTGRILHVRQWARARWETCLCRFNDVHEVAVGCELDAMRSERTLLYYALVVTKTGKLLPLGWHGPDPADAERLAGALAVTVGAPLRPVELERTVQWLYDATVTRPPGNSMTSTMLQLMILGIFALPILAFLVYEWLSLRQP
ncbi:MAG: hypothetical protein AMXMBFR33_25670 [Candidatus Xenobia bacterium]